MKEENRNSSIELLRVISMILIVLAHFVTHNKLNTSNLKIEILKY